MTDCSNLLKFREAVREFAQKEVAPRAAEVDKSNNFPSVRLKQNTYA